MKKAFANELLKQALKNKRVVLLTGDVGFGVLDEFKEKLPNQYYNCGVAEQNMVGVACGMAQGGLIPFVYSITPFLIYRAFEFIRNDVDYDEANVKLVGVGRLGDYKDLGISHCSYDDKKIMRLFKNIAAFWPKTKEEVRSLVKLAVTENGPFYINLER